MSNKWTIESTRELIKAGYWFSDSTFNKKLIVKIEDDVFIFFCEDEDDLISHGLTNSTKFYDPNMNLIEPPKEREFEILEWWYYPLSKNIRLNSSSYEGFKEICSNEEANAIKVKGADKFKRYLDTGEIEVMK